MGFIPAKCTQCGAEITVDDTKDAGICKYCGTAFVTEKAINNYNTYITNDYEGATINVVKGDASNLVMLAQNALWTGNTKEAYDYANKALEIDTELPKAWLIKMKAKAEELDEKTCDGKAGGELITYGYNAIIYADDMDIGDGASLAMNEKTAGSKIVEEVFTTYLFTASKLMSEANFVINSVSDLLNIINEDNKYEVSCKDAPIRDRMDELASSAANLVMEIPPQYFQYIQYMSDLTASIAESYVSYCEGDKYRRELYGLEIDQYFINERLENIRQFNLRLPESKAVSVPNLAYEKKAMTPKESESISEGESESLFGNLKNKFSKWF